jgi:hypothetical protein
MGDSSFRRKKIMIIYQASLSLRILKMYWDIFHERLSVLLSYAYVGDDIYQILVTFRHMVFKLIFDSGAWSKDSGVASHLSLEGLIGYLLNTATRFDFYISFDTDFSDNGFDRNIVNQIKMENAGLNPVPVVHNLFDGEIDYYLSSGKYDYIALGSSQITNFDDLAYAVYRIKRGNPDIKIHWFGGSRFDWLCKLPIASCDTTSWAKTGEFGHINYWNAHVSGLNKTHKIYTAGTLKDNFESGEYHYVTYPWRDEVDQYLKDTFGLTYGDLCGYDAVINMMLVNVRFYAEQEKRINEERLRRGIPLE